MDGSIINGDVISRRWLLGAAVASTARLYTTTAPSVLMYDVMDAGSGGRPVTAAGTPLTAVYAQSMGETTNDGYVVRFPLSRNGGARQMFVDSVNGDDRYNGLSPHPGFKPNGTGRFDQHDASGQGTAASGWGPKKTMMAAEKALPITDWQAAQIGVGHQVLLAEGGVYNDPSSTEYGSGRRAAHHYGLSTAYPYVIQSYDPTDPWNAQKHGRATGSRRAEIRLSSDRQWNFQHDINASDGIISNFAFRGLRFTTLNGTRSGADHIIIWNNIDSDNVLFENVDFGPCKLTLDNTSDRTTKPRWSRNFIIRKCLIDRNYSETGNRFGGIHIANAMGVVLEDVIFNHSTWKEDAEGRYPSTPTDNTKANIFRHDVYLAGESQAPNIVRRCVSMDAALDFLSSRNGAEAYNNVCIDAPVGMAPAGGVADINVEQPNGNWYDMHHNLVMGSSTLTGPTWQINEQPTPGTTFIRAGNVEFEFIDAGQPTTTGRNPITIGASTASTAANIAGVLNGRPEPLLQRVAWRTFAGPTGPEIRQTPRKPGAPLVTVEAYGPGIGTIDCGVRSCAFVGGNGVSESAIRDSLAINSGYVGNTHNTPNASPFSLNQGVSGRISYANFKRIRTYAWGPDQEAEVTKAGTTATFADVTYDPTSPYTNDAIYAALGYAGKMALRDAMVAEFERPWALIIQQKVGALFGFDFDVPAVTPPVIAQTYPASTMKPHVGDTITFPDPHVTSGIIVSASTYASNAPIANTGKAQNTLTLTRDHEGKRISRMVVVAPLNGGPTTTVLTEIQPPVAPSATSTA